MTVYVVTLVGAGTKSIHLHSLIYQFSHILMIWERNLKYQPGYWRLISVLECLDSHWQPRVNKKINLVF